MSKLKAKHKAEAARAGSMDHILTYLEAGDYRPPLRHFLPSQVVVWPGFQKSVWSAASRAHRGDAVPLGLVAAAQRPGDMFQVDCCWPVEEFAARTNRMLPGSFRLPKDAIVAKVVSSYIRKDGTVRQSIPVHVYTADKNTDGTEIRGYIWHPVVEPTVLRQTHVITSGGLMKVYDDSATGYKGLAPSISLALQFSLRTLWSVRVGCENGRSELILPADETGVKGFYDLRESPLTAAGRRAALKHWVNSHGRLIGTESETRVKGHYRGAERFDWFGLSCRVVEPGENAF